MSTFIGTSGNDGYIGEATTIIGRAGHDFLQTLSPLDVTIRGGTGRDTLLGHDGNDTLKGGRGSDILNGEAGEDILRGGRGADTFVFDIASAGTGVDKVKDFKSGVDHILLSGFDASDTSYHNGKLFMHTDGGDVLLAKFAHHPHLHDNDFIV